MWIVQVKHAFEKWRLQATLNPTNSNLKEGLFSLMFIWLYEKRKSTPRGKDCHQLNRNGRVKEISMAIAMKAQQVTDLVKDSFPELHNADLTK